MRDIPGLIEKHRATMRQAIKRGDMETAGFFARVIVGMRDVPVRLRPVAAILAEAEAADKRRKGRKARGNGKRS